MIDPPITLVYIEGQETEPLPDYKPKHTPDIIREIRESLGESQTEFGARFGYTQAHMSNLEKGKVPIMPVFDLALDEIDRTSVRPKKRRTGAELRTIRESLRMTRPCFADLMKVSVRAIEGVERPERKHRNITAELDTALEVVARLARKGK